MGSVYDPIRKISVNEFVHKVREILEDWQDQGDDTEYHFRDQLFNLCQRFTGIDLGEDEE